MKANILDSIERISIRFLMRLRAKLRNWVFFLGNIEVNCPLCDQEVGIEDLNECETGPHFMCEECSIHYEDATLCKACEVYPSTPRSAA